ncbi:MAG: tetratricopeptide repeat protein, partial [Planctomycetota bacterium]
MRQSVAPPAGMLESLSRLGRKRKLSGLGRDELLTLAALCLPGPDVTEFAAANLFGSAALQALLDRDLAFRGKGAVVSPSPGIRRTLKPVLREDRVRIPLHRFFVQRIRALGRKIPKPERLPLLAHHAREARDTATAASAAVSLARFFTSHKRPADGIECLQAVLPLVRGKKRRRNVLKALRKTAGLAGDKRTSLRAAREMARLCPNPQNLRILAEHAQDAGRPSEVERALGRALQLNPGDRERASILAVRASHYAARRLAHAAARDVEALKTLGMHLSDRAVLRRMHVALGNHLLEEKQFREALQHYRTASRFCRAKEDHQAPLGILVNSCIASINARAFPEALEFLRLLRKRLRSRGDRNTQARLFFLRSWLELEQGRPRISYSLMLRAARSYRETSNPFREAEQLQNASYVAHYLDRIEDARNLCHRAIAILGRLGERKRIISAKAVLAQVHARGGRFEDARNILKECETALSTIEYPLGRQFVLRANIEVEREMGRWRKALSLSRTAEKNARKMGDLPRAVEFRLSSAEALLRLARTDAARKTLKPALKLAETLNPVLEAEARIW